MSDLATAVAIARVIQKGDTGDRGPTGDVGSRGERGLPGRDGHNGRDGTDGKNGVDGRDGNAGRDGVDGRDGQQGERGLPGRDGRDGKSINPRGPWNANVVYEPLDLVSIDGGSYVCTQLSKGSRPPGAGWMTSAEKGDRGKDGRDGYNGVSAPFVSVGGGGSNYTAGTGIEISTDGVISLATALSVTAFTGGSINRRGVIVASASLAWAYSKDPIDSQEISGTGTTPLANALVRAQTVTGPFTSDQTFGISVTKGAENASATASVLFRDDRYWGVSASTTLNNAGVLALGNAELATSRQQTRVMTPSAQYMYFAFPTSFGTPTFKSNGFNDTDWSKVATIASFVNASGGVVSIDVWRSGQLATGTFTEEVL